jgi:maltose alpha-D-glucosyltransferase/alpha-amylase
MLGGDRRRIELAFALMLALPGTPVLFYGDEIGMGDDLSLPERNSVRTPMQWSSATHAGFSTASRSELTMPVISRGRYGYRQVNVADQYRDSTSLLHFVRRAVRAHRELGELGGDWEQVKLRRREVFALRYELNGRQLLVVHNLGEEPLQVRGLHADGLADAFANRVYPEAGQAVELDGYGFRWLRPPQDA